VSRAQRLLDLIQLLRRHRFPVRGAALADELGVSLRTLYRDIAVLNVQGAHIDGEAGVGYVLRPGFMLPPLMFSEEEIEALVLGSRWVAERADGPLRAAARNALARIVAVLPDDLRDGADASGLLVGPGEAIAAGDAELMVAWCELRRGYRFPHRPHRRAEALGQALPPPTPGAAQGVARGRAHPAAVGLVARMEGPVRIRSLG
jgi:biotin operon repressor